MWSLSSAPSSPPWGLEWRSSVWFVTFVVGFGVATDLFSYAVIIPVIPFRLEALGYSDASARTGWLLFAYSGGLAVSTPPVAWFSERYNARRTPLILGLFTLIGAQIMFMLAPFYWIMAVARIIQGVSSTCVWTVGLALLCDTTPEARVGQQLGFAMAGLSAGVVLAPPIGGALYQRLGFHAPFIFVIGIVLFDLLGRLLVIERKNALRWGVDPAAAVQVTDSEPAHSDNTEALEKNSSLTPPVPNNEVLTRSNSIVIGLDSRADTFGNRHDDVIFMDGYQVNTRPSTCDQHQDIVSDEISPTGGYAGDKLQTSPDGMSNPIRTAEPGTLLSSVQEESSERGLADSKTKAAIIATGQIPQNQGLHLVREKGEQNALPQLVESSDVTPKTTPEMIPQLSSGQVLSAMFRSRRALAAFSNTLIYGITYSSQEPTLPLRLQNPYGMSSLKVGLVYIASSVPTLLSGPIAGWLSDRKGTGVITITCLLLAIPWFIVMAIHGPLALLIISAVVSNFFISAVVAPLTAELAAVTRELPGVGYSHVYGAFNLAYGIGSAIGPILGGQLYDHIHHGWTAVVGLAAGLILLATAIAFLFTDETPVARRLLGLRRRFMVKGTRHMEA